MCVAVDKGAIISQNLNFDKSIDHLLAIDEIARKTADKIHEVRKIGNKYTHETTKKASLSEAKKVLKSIEVMLIVLYEG